MRQCGLSETGLEYGLAGGFCKNDNESFSSIKGSEYLDLLCEYKLPKRNNAPEFINTFKQNCLPVYVTLPHIYMRILHSLKIMSVGYTQSQNRS